MECLRHCGFTSPGLIGPLLLGVSLPIPCARVPFRAPPPYPFIRWLARVYLGDELEANRTRVKRLVTLGTPHLPADPDSNAPDQTRGLLNYINKEYPGSFHREVEYVSVAGKHRKGAFFWDDPDKEPECGGTRFEKFFVGAGYWTVCGTLEVWGDSIVPVQSALLPDSQEVILQGVYHSPLGDDDRAAAWYGSPDNIDKWAEALV